MRKFLGAGLFLATVLLLVFGLSAFLPKYAGFLRILTILLILDAGLWLSTNRYPVFRRKTLRFIIGAIYWAPLVVGTVTFIVSLFFPFRHWAIPFRTYLVTFLLIILLARIIPMMVWVLIMSIHTVRWIIRKVILRVPGANFSLEPGVTLKVAWGAGFVVVLALLWGVFFGQHDFTVVRQEIKSGQLPAAFNGMKIVQVSDIHLGSWTSRKKLAEAVSIINGLQPDMIFITGDMFNYETAEGPEFTDILKKISAKEGIFAILGNHDYGDYITWPDQESKNRNMADLYEWYRHLGWKLLLNEHVILKRGADSIAIIGVENWGATRRFQRHGDLAGALSGAEQVPFQLLLSHDPSHWDSIVSKYFPSVDITFSGHTHGAQIGMITDHIRWSPSSWAYQHWAGLYENTSAPEPQYLYVNRGLGTVGYAGRIGITPEITLFILKN